MKKYIKMYEEKQRMNCLAKFQVIGSTADQQLKVDGSHVLEEMLLLYLHH